MQFPKHKKSGKTGKKTDAAHAKKRKPRKSVMRRLLAFLFILGLWGAAAAIVLVLYYAHDLPDTGKLYEKTATSPSIRILARDGALLANIGERRGDYVPYEEFPPHLVEAVLATEDRRFFAHGGIDLFGLMRAMLANLRAGGVVQGGSTVTQQLAKIVFLSPDRTIKRKIQEVILALWIEARFSKQEILTMYLNRAYLGTNSFGIDAAAHVYFGKKTKDLSLTESALIAGLLKAPSRYSPYSNPRLAGERINQVLANMEDAGFITGEEAKGAPPARILAARPLNKSMFFADWIISQLPDYVGIVDRNIAVTTTLDTKLQKLAEDSIKLIADKQYKYMHIGDGALVSMTPQGEVLAMVGGLDYGQSQFNRAAQALRQPGSSFKTFVYLSALERGFHPGDELEDVPIAIGDWAPMNYDEEYHGVMTLTEAFARSINTIAVQLSEMIGRGRAVEVAQRLGITTPLAAHPSTALGTSDVTLLELTQAYAHLASGGKAVRAYGITEIRTDSGEVLYRTGDYHPPRVLDAKLVRTMNQLTMAVVNNGTGRRAQLPGRPVAGKTGTSQEFRDAWFIGYIPQMITGVWTGNDDNSPMKKVTGGVIPAMIWHNYMEGATAGMDVEDIPVEGSFRALFDQVIGGTDDPVDAPGDTPPEAEKERFWERLNQE